MLLPKHWYLWNYTTSRHRNPKDRNILAAITPQITGFSVPLLVLLTFCISLNGVHKLRREVQTL
jgi:hypothetical protein